LTTKRSPWTSAWTLAGRGMGFFPMRDMDILQKQ
jgi:hypothetical protein